jgi:peptidoglycan/LPS O-acetylase OafA/YrhL
MRFFRLYPAYWVSLALGAVTLSSTRATHFNSAQILANITMLQLALKQPDVLGVYWTLFSELLFYLLCAAACGARVLMAPRYLFAAAAAFTCLPLAGLAFPNLQPHNALPVCIPVFLGIMHCGTLVRLGWLEQNAEAKRLASMALGLILATHPLVMGAGFSKATLSYGIANTTALYLGMALFHACVTVRWFANRITVFFGTISYSLYLLHPIAILCTLTAASPVLRLTGNALAAFGLSTLLAVISFRLVERPGIRLGRSMTAAASLPDVDFH